MERRAVDVLHELHGLLSEVLPSLGDRRLRQRAALRDLHQDLLQLRDEFDEVQFDLRRHLIVAVTPSIELEEIALGPFRIELHLDRLVEHANASAFDLIALRPNPADSNEDVTHPHVRDRQLCAGDATVPIARALEQGRICDAFLAVAAVLKTYNPGSPYVSLSDWHGQPCSDCGYTVGPDDSRACDGCEKEFCKECIGWCEVCESSYCRSCLEEDPQSGRSCCRSCRHRCGACHRVVDADSFVEETGLCPECHEERTQPQEKENQDEFSNPATAPEPDSGRSPQSPAPVAEIA